MIAAISDWLKQIIVMILLATFVELILPGKSMERYVKVVVSLFILLAILAPIIQLLRSDFDLELVLAPSATKDRQAEMVSIQGIMEAGDEMQAKREQQVIAMLESNIEQLMQEQIEQDFLVEVERLSVATELDRHGEPVLHSIDLVIQMVEPKQGSEPPKRIKAEEAKEGIKMNPIEPVQPVSIEIEWTETKKSSRPEGNIGYPTEAAEQLASEIKAWLAARWSISSSAIWISVVP